MSDSASFGFGKFIPGFDFLQNLAKAGQAAPGMPPLSHWVAPTVRIEEIDKRIEELKAVQFWLEQNSRALAATVQALEVQKMTLSTLQGMNVNLAELGKAFPFAAAAPVQEPTPAAPHAAASPHADWPMSGKAKPAQEPPPETSTTPPAGDGGKGADTSAGPGVGGGALPGLGDPMQWWGALTQQFQHIAAQALQDPAQSQAMAQATQMAADFASTALQAAGQVARAGAAATPSARKSAPRKKAAQPAAKKSSTARKPAAKAAGKAASKTASPPRAGSPRRPPR